MYHPPPTHETHETPFRPIPVYVQAQQKHQQHRLFSGLSTFLSTVLRQFVTKLCSPLLTLFPPDLYKAILSPILFMICTNDCTGSNTTPVIKYSDDSAVEDLSNCFICIFVFGSCFRMLAVILFQICLFC